MYNLKAKNTETGEELNFTIPTPSNPYCYVIQDITGLTSGNVTPATTQGNSQVGTTVQGLSVNAAQMIVDGMIIGPSTQRRERMLEVLVPGVEIKVTFDDWLYRNGYLIEWPDIGRKERDQYFQFTLYCPYPYWRRDNMSLTDVAGLIPRFHFPINYYNTYFENPKIHMFGERIKAGWVNVDNQGNVPSAFKIIFVANTSVTGPKISLIEKTGITKVISIRPDYEMQPGEVIEVDMTGSKITAISKIGSLETNIFKYLTRQSEFFYLTVGDNLIQYDAEINKDNLDVRILHYDTYSGAFGDDETY